MSRRLIPIFFLLFVFLYQTPLAQSQEQPLQPYLIKPGDTWTALSLRYDIPTSDLIAKAGTINTQRQPAIGSSLLLPPSSEINGRLIRPFSGGILQTSARAHSFPWALALQNGIHSPYSPLLYTPLVLPDDKSIPRENPSGFRTLSVSPATAVPGQALLLQARVEPQIEPEIMLGEKPWLVSSNNDHLLALTATGAFFDTAQVDLSIYSDNEPLWTQPWLFEVRDWNYETVDFASTPATDLEILRSERERLQEIWGQITPQPLWKGSFQSPLQDYVELTSHYGARRSVNGGAYDTYHEGTDYSAYGGTAVLAPAGGRVSLAEPLIVRGGAVILDHGLGIHSGYYHLSRIAVTEGQIIEAGDLLGEVGSTGRSTGNHLHWDMLIGTTWVDAESWMETSLAAHIQNAWGADFPLLDRRDIPINK